MFKKYFNLKCGDQNFCRLYLPNKNSKDIPIIIYCHGWTKPILGGGRMVGGAPKAVRNLAIKNNIGFLSFDQFGEYRTWGDNRYFTHARWGEGVKNAYDYIVSSGISRMDLLVALAFQVVRQLLSEWNKNISNWHLMFLLQLR